MGQIFHLTKRLGAVAVQMCLIFLLTKRLGAVAV